MEYAFNKQDYLNIFLNKWMSWFCNISSTYAMAQKKSGHDNM